MNENISQTPLVTVVTIVLNGVDTIEKTIQSVLNQTYDNIEYIIIDGGSTDGTLDIIRKYKGRINRWISEPDKGIYDAMNKGIDLANGEYLQFIHADDWLSSNQIEKAVNCLIENSSYGFVFGDMIMYEKSKPSYKIIGDPNYYKKITYRMPALNHPTVLSRTAIYSETKGFVNYKVAMDYDWFLRGYLKGVKGVYFNEIVGHMSLEGISVSQVKKGWKEVKDSAIKNTNSKLKPYIYYCFCNIKLFIKTFLEKIFSRKATLILRKCLLSNTYNSIQQ